jgi:hypothetical protein
MATQSDFRVKPEDWAEKSPGTRPAGQQWEETIFPGPGRCITLSFVLSTTMPAHLPWHLHCFLWETFRIQTSHRPEGLDC